MPEARLLAHIEDWESRRRRFNPVFPAPLEARFEAETGPARARELGTYSLISLLFLAPWDLVSMGEPGAPRFGHLVHLAIVLPPIAVSGLVLLRAPSKPAREWIGFVMSVLVPISSAWLFLSGLSPDPALLAIAMVAGLTAACTVAALRLWWAIAAALVIALTHGATLALAVPPPAYGPAHFGSTVVVGLWLLAAGRRQEYENRAAYLLGLRQRLAAERLLRQNRELADQSRRDALTGLANRRHFDERFAASWRNAIESGERVAVIMADIDRFKDYNDFYGHAAGDACLVAIARCMSEQLRQRGDIVARLGGEEFAVLLEGADCAIAADVAERLRAAVAAMELPHLGIGARGQVTISAGVAACTPAQGRTPQALLAAADAALYAAKGRGRNQVTIGELLSPQVEAEEDLFRAALMARAGFPAPVPDP